MFSKPVIFSGLKRLPFRYSFYDVEYKGFLPIFIPRKLKMSGMVFISSQPVPVPAKSFSRVGGAPNVKLSINCVDNFVNKLTLHGSLRYKLK